MNANQPEAGRELDQFIHRELVGVDGADAPPYSTDWDVAQELSDHFGSLMVDAMQGREAYTATLTDENRLHVAEGPTKALAVCRAVWKSISAVVE